MDKRLVPEVRDSMSTTYSSSSGCFSNPVCSDVVENQGFPSNGHRQLNADDTFENLESVEQQKAPPHIRTPSTDIIDGQTLDKIAEAEKQHLNERDVCIFCDSVQRERQYFLWNSRFVKSSFCSRCADDATGRRYVSYWGTPSYTLGSWRKRYREGRSYEIDTSPLLEVLERIDNMNAGPTSNKRLTSSTSDATSGLETSKRIESTTACYHNKNDLDVIVNRYIQTNIGKDKEFDNIAFDGSDDIYSKCTPNDKIYREADITLHETNNAPRDVEDDQTKNQTAYHFMNTTDRFDESKSDSDYDSSQAFQAEISEDDDIFSEAPEEPVRQKLDSSISMRTAKLDESLNGEDSCSIEKFEPFRVKKCSTPRKNKYNKVKLSATNYDTQAMNNNVTYYEEDPVNSWVNSTSKYTASYNSTHFEEGSHNNNESDYRFDEHDDSKDYKNDADCVKSKNTNASNHIGQSMSRDTVHSKIETQTNMLDSSTRACDTPKSQLRVEQLDHNVDIDKQSKSYKIKPTEKDCSENSFKDKLNFFTNRKERRKSQEHNQTALGHKDSMVVFKDKFNESQTKYTKNRFRNIKLSSVEESDKEQLSIHTTKTCKLTDKQYDSSNTIPHNISNKSTNSKGRTDNKSEKKSKSNKLLLTNGERSRRRSIRQSIDFSDSIVFKMFQDIGTYNIENKRQSIKDGSLHIPTSFWENIENSEDEQYLTIRRKLQNRKKQSRTSGYANGPVLTNSKANGPPHSVEGEMPNYPALSRLRSLYPEHAIPSLGNTWTKRKELLDENESTDHHEKSGSESSIDSNNNSGNAHQPANNNKACDQFKVLGDNDNDKQTYTPIKRLRSVYPNLEFLTRRRSIRRESLKASIFKNDNFISESATDETGGGESESAAGCGKRPIKTLDQNNDNKENDQLQVVDNDKQKYTPVKPLRSMYPNLEFLTSSRARKRESLKEPISTNSHFNSESGTEEHTGSGSNESDNTSQYNSDFHNKHTKQMSHSDEANGFDTDDDTHESENSLMDEKMNNYRDSLVRESKRLEQFQRKKSIGALSIQDEIEAANFEQSSLQNIRRERLRKINTDLALADKSVSETKPLSRIRTKHNVSELSDGKDNETVDNYIELDKRDFEEFELNWRNRGYNTDFCMSRKSATGSEIIDRYQRALKNRRMKDKSRRVRNDIDDDDFRNGMNELFGTPNESSISAPVSRRGSVIKSLKRKEALEIGKPSTAPNSRRTSKTMAPNSYDNSYVSEEESDTNVKKGVTTKDLQAVMEKADACSERMKQRLCQQLLH